MNIHTKQCSTTKMVFESDDRHIHVVNMFDSDGHREVCVQFNKEKSRQEPYPTILEYTFSGDDLEARVLELAEMLVAAASPQLRIARGGDGE